MLDFKYFVRRPFSVEAVEITLDNMDEIAKLIGTVRKKGDLVYIALDGRVIPNVKKAYVGWFMTQLEDNYRVYSPKLFKSEFLPYEDSITFTFDGGPDEHDEADESTTAVGTLRAVPNSDA